MSAVTLFEERGSGVGGGGGRSGSSLLVLLPGNI